MDSATFAQWFRASSPYIRAHRNKVFVVYLSPATLAHPLLTNIVHDLALLNVLGIQQVLVLGIGTQDGNEVHSVDQLALEDYIREVGLNSQRLESAFATGVPSSHFHAQHIPLVSGNFLLAKPKGIVNGRDTAFAGELRSVQSAEIQRLLAAHMVVMIPPLGYSSTGSVYTLDANEIALQLAVAIQADKLILFSDLGKVGDHSDLTTSALDEVLDEIPLAPMILAQLRALGMACRLGVDRAHSIPHDVDGALLQELFTTDGIGTQISDSAYRTIRVASSDDISSIAELLKPLEDSGLLLDRSRLMLVEAPERFMVSELDGVVTGCVALYGQDQRMMEIGSLATSPLHQGMHIGRQLLRAAEKESVKRGATSAYVLTTQAMDWFKDNGYVEVSLSDLPRSRLEKYSAIRNSKPLMKKLTNDVAAG